MNTSYHNGVEPLLDLRALTVRLPTAAGWVSPVQDVTFELAPGESLGLVGESGSGKTMLALALVDLLPAGAQRTGHAFLRTGQGAGAQDLLALSDKELIPVRGRDIGFVFQEPMTALNPVMRVEQQIAEGIRAHEPQLAARDVQQRTVEALERARIPNAAVRARQFPHQLSGGLRQRVMIAMALAAGPRLLVADEPTTALDVTVQKEILELLARLRDELGLSLLFITHDLAVVAQVADRMAVMYAGRIIEIGPSQQLLRNPRHPYTQALLRASPQLGRQRLQPIPGSVPALGALPRGCAFEPRCTQRQQGCAEGVPAASSAAPGHSVSCILVPSEHARTGKR